MQRVTLGTSTISIRTEADGAPVAAGSVSVAAVAHDGTTVTLTPAQPNTPSAGLHRATATVTRPTHVDLTWTIDGVQWPDSYDVVSRYYMTVLEARESDSTLDDETAYPHARIEKAIDVAAAELDRITGRSWTRRYVIVTATPDHLGRVRVAPDVRRIGAWKLDGTTQDIAAVKVVPGTDLVQLPCVCSGVVELGAEVGMDEPPVDLVEAFGQRVRYWAQRRDMSTPLYSEVVDVNGQPVPRARPTVQSTGNPDIDAIYQAHAFAGLSGFA